MGGILENIINFLEGEGGLVLKNYQSQFIEIIANDPYIMSVLKVVEQVNMKDSWVCAGLLRNKVWDVLHNTKTPINDIDVIYFDGTDTSKDKEKHLEKILDGLMPNQPWSVKNQARMHKKWWHSLQIIL